MDALTPLALQHADLLRALAEPGEVTTLAAFGRANGHPDRSNFNRVLKQLEADGLIATAEGLILPVLTHKARAALAAIERAEGVAEPGRVRTWPWNRTRPNPLNPRKRFDDETIASMSESIVAREADGRRGIIHPLTLFPADAEGVRQISDGEYRWRAVELAVKAGLLPEDHPLPFDEEPAAEGQEATEILLTALTTSSQRTALPTMDEARGYIELTERTGWSLAEAGRRTGRNKRLVQEMVAVANKAAPADIVAYEAGVMTWQALRESIRELEPPPEQALILVELADKGIREPADADVQRAHGYDRKDNWTALRFRPHGPVSALEMRGLVKVAAIYDGSGRAPSFGRAVVEHPRLAEWLDTNGFHDNRAALLKDLRTRVHGEAAAADAEAHDYYLTDWLRLTDPKQTDLEDHVPSPDAPAHIAARAGVQPPPPQPDPEPDAWQRLTMLELLHKARAQQIADIDNYEPGLVAEVGEHWRSQAAQDLSTALRFVAFTAPPGPHGWVGKILLKGVEWLELRLGGRLADVTDEALDAAIEQARNAVGQAGWPGPGYASAFLNRPEPAAPPAPPVDVPSQDLAGYVHALHTADGQPPAEVLHPDTADLVERFAKALADKLLQSQVKHGHTNAWARDDWQWDCREQLLVHVEKGDPLDVAAYAAFCWHHGWPTGAGARAA